jgi:hypothetical protein
VARNSTRNRRGDVPPTEISAGAGRREGPETGCVGCHTLRRAHAHSPPEQRSPQPAWRSVAHARRPRYSDTRLVNLKKMRIWPTKPTDASLNMSDCGAPVGSRQRAGSARHLRTQPSASAPKLRGNRCAPARVHGSARASAQRWQHLTALPNAARASSQLLLRVRHSRSRIARMSAPLSASMRMSCVHAVQRHGETAPREPRRSAGGADRVTRSRQRTPPLPLLRAPSTPWRRSGRTRCPRTAQTPPARPRPAGDR